MGIRDISDGGGNGYGGVYLLAEGSGSNDFHGFSYFEEGANVEASTNMFEDGVVYGGAGAAGGGREPMSVTIEVMGNKETGSQPYFNIISTAAGDNELDSRLDFETIWSTAFSSSWNPLELKNFGVMVRIAGAASDPAIQFSYLLIRTHPYLT
jgi:hypothetical protein